MKQRAMHLNLFLALAIVSLQTGCSVAALQVDDLGACCSDSGASVADVGEDASEQLDLALASPASCLEVKAANQDAVDGFQTLYFGHDSTRPWVAWCDQTTDGGGWTALLGPFGANNDGGVSVVPGVTWRAKVVGGTFGTCPASTEVVDASGWQDLRTYVCGDQTVLLSIAWKNTIGARDVMLTATIQGQQTRSLTVNGRGYQADATASDKDGARCDFWNGVGKSITPVPNQCWSLVLPVPPRVFSSAITTDDDLLVELVAGPSGSPNGLHGAGANVSRLFVR